MRTLALIAVLILTPTLAVFGIIAVREFYRAAAYWITVGLNRARPRRWDISGWAPTKTVTLVCPHCLHDRRAMVTFHDFATYARHLTAHRPAES